MAWYHRLFNIVRSEGISRDIDREMEFHIAERVDELRARGLSAGDAERVARRQFGNRTTHRESARDADIAEWLQSVVGDVRYALRALRHSPAFTIVAIASLGLGIGANTTIFTLIDTLVLRALPVARPEELAQVSPDETASSGGYFTNPLWEQVRDRQDVFRAVAAFGGTSFDLASSGEARRVSGGYVSGDYFTVFAVTPAVGRLFTRSDDQRGCPGIAVLSHRFWTREYGGVRDVVGKSINLTGHPFEIVGVAAESFRGPDVGREADVYAPLCSEAIVAGDASALDRRSNWWLQAIGRLERGMDVAQADARIATIARASYAETLPSGWSAKGQRDYLERPLHVYPAQRGLSDLRSQYRPALLVLMGGVALVLLIACANVANLLLSRAEARQRELAIRLAIGAGRARLVRQLLTESLILAFAGATVGLFVARMGTRAMVGMIATGRSWNAVSLDLSLNGRLLAFTIAIAVLTVLIFGLIPAWRATRVSANSAMKAQARGVVEGRSRWALGKSLVVAQVALSLMLVVAAGLLVSTFRNLLQVDPGFTPNGILLLTVDLRRSGIAEDGIRATQASIVERVRGMPGVVNVGSTGYAPVGGRSWNEEVVIDGYVPKSEHDAVTWFNEASPGYFATMETRLLAGRDFGRSDAPGAPRVAIVNDAWGRRFFGNATPIGKQFRLRAGDSLGTPVTVVGVVENAKYNSIREDVQPIAYLEESQTGPHEVATLAVRTRGDPSAMIDVLTRAIGEVHSGITLDITTMSRQLSQSLQRERLLAVLSALFGMLALLLAILGLYGVMSYTVARRRGEIGVRIALGAARDRVVRMVLGEVATVVLIGIVIGGAVSLASARLITAFLYNLRPVEPGVYALAIVVLIAATLAAGFVPAWRAARVDPIEALREE
jgi:putative ABC transport system permease protein